MKKKTTLLAALLLVCGLQLKAQDLKQPEQYKGEALSLKMGLLSRLRFTSNGNGQLLKTPLSQTPYFGYTSNDARNASRSATDTDYGFNSTLYQGVNVPLQSVSDGLGNVYITGVSADSESPKGSFVTLKTDALGNIAWVYKKPVSEFAVEYGTAITLDASGNPIASGMHWNGTDMDVHTVKMDAATGTIVWQANFNGAAGGLDVPTAITTDNSGNTLISGISYAGTSIRYLVLKYNQTGLLQWSYTDDNAVEDVWNEPAAIATDASGNIAVTGYGSNSNYYQTYYTVKLDSGGNKLWSQDYMFQAPSDPEDPESPLADTNSIANDVQFDGSGNCYVTGIMNTAWGTMGTIKYDPNGIQQWIAMHQSGTDNTTAHQIEIAGNTVYVSGRHMGDWVEDGLVLVSYDTDGTENWVRETTDLADAKAPKMLLAAGQPTISGYGYDAEGNTLFKTLRYAENGDIVVEAAYTIPAVPIESLGGLVGLSVDNAGNFYLSLSYTYTASGQVFRVVKMPLSSGSHEPAWNTIYAGNALNNKSLLAALPGPDGSVYTAGTFGQIEGENYITNYYLEKYGATGNVEWQKVFNPANGNDCNGIQMQVTPTGEAVVYLIPWGFGDPVKLKRYHADGTLSWEYEKTVYNPIFGTLFTDSQGNTYLSGASKENEADENLAFTTIKISSSGEEQWVAYTPSPNAGDNIYNIDSGTADADGNVIIAGSVGTGSFFSQDISAAILKYNSSGAQQWVTATPMAGYNSAATSILSQDDGNLIVNGAISNQDTGQEQMILRKYNPDGQQQWESIVGDAGRNVRSYKTLMLANGDMAVAAFSVIYGVDNKVLVIRFDAQGNQVSIDETDLAHFYRDICTDGTDVYLLSQYYDTTLPFRVFYSAGPFYAGKVTKFSTDTQTQETLIGPALSPYNPANFVIKDNSLLIPGTLESDAYVFQGVYFFESEFELLGRTEPGAAATHQNWLGQNYPNPAKSMTTIPIHLQNAGMVSLELFDMTGRFIKTLYKGILPQGKSSIDISVSGLGKGIYLYKGTVEQGTAASHKLIVK
jgi:hypothetical protein